MTDLVLAWARRVHCSTTYQNNVPAITNTSGRSPAHCTFSLDHIRWYSFNVIGGRIFLWGTFLLLEAGSAGMTIPNWEAQNGSIWTLPSQAGVNFVKRQPNSLVGKSGFRRRKVFLHTIGRTGHNQHFRLRLIFWGSGLNCAASYQTIRVSTVHVVMIG